MKNVEQTVRRLTRTQWIVFPMLAVAVMLACATPVRSDDIHLKDGSLIKGEVINEVPGQSYTVLRADGSQQVFPADQVESVQLSNPVSVENQSSVENQPVVLAQAPSKSRKGLSIGLGLGASIPTDEASYGGLGTDLYPELRVQSDLGPLELGFSLGYLYRETTTYTYSSHYHSSSYGYTMAFVPMEFHVNVLPVRFFTRSFPVQPYFGLGLGGYMAAGDNEDSYGMVSPTLGVEFFLGEHNIVGLDYSYHSIATDDDEMDLNYSTIMACYRFRFPMGRQ